MILNLRPQDLGLLDCVVEECDERFNEAQQKEILGIIREVLGSDETENSQQHIANGLANVSKGLDTGEEMEVEQSIGNG